MWSFLSQTEYPSPFIFFIFFTPIFILFFLSLQAEYMSGLDMVWAVRALHLFSSFRLRAIYYRPTMHLVKLVILVIYAATFQSSSAQAFGMMGLLVVVALVALAVRPFRLTVFNVVLVFGYFCLTADALFGGVITQFNPTQVREKHVHCLSLNEEGLIAFDVMIYSSMDKAIFVNFVLFSCV